MNAHKEERHHTPPTHFPRLIWEWSLSLWLPYSVSPHTLVSALKQSAVPQPSHLLLAMSKQRGSHKSWQTLQSGSVNDSVQYGVFGNGWNCEYKSRHWKPDDGRGRRAWLFPSPPGDISWSNYASLSVATECCGTDMLIFLEKWGW